MELIIKKFDELSIEELYEILKLRSEVFVVEQNCVYQDLDGKDRGAYHLYIKENGAIIAYLRVMDRGVSFSEPSIGRVVCIRRRCGIGSALLKAGIQAARERYGAKRIIIEAQCYARSFNELQGFVQSSDEFLEDGIPHIQMTLDLK